MHGDFKGQNDVFAPKIFRKELMRDCKKTEVKLKV